MVGCPKNEEKGTQKKHGVCFFSVFTTAEMRTNTAIWVASLISPQKVTVELGIPKRYSKAMVGNWGQPKKPENSEHAKVSTNTLKFWVGSWYLGRRYMDAGRSTGDTPSGHQPAEKLVHRKSR